MPDTDRSGEYRGMKYEVPPTDDGEWNWIVYSKHQIGVACCQGYHFPTTELATMAAKRAIDAIIENGEPDPLHIRDAGDPRELFQWRGSLP